MDEHATERSTVDALGIRPPCAYAVESCTTPAGDVVLTFAGELDLAAAPVVREQLEAAAATGARMVVLDMTAVTFVDSSALRELLRADGALRLAGGTLVLAAVPPAVVRLLELTRTDDVLASAPSVEAALRRP
jgi:anti-sigma B factor antagonist